MIFIDYQNTESADLYLNYQSSGKEFIYLKFLEWDSSFFKKPSYTLDISKSNFEPNSIAKEELEKYFTDSFITAKLDTRLDYKYTYFLEQCGFYYVDTEVKLQNTLLSHPKFTDNVTIKEMSSNNSLPIQALGEAFNLTRFHCDPHISQTKADGLWISYLENFIPSKTKKMYVAKVSDEIAGIILATINPSEIFLFFVAVLEPYRSQRVGSILMSNALKQLQGNTPIYTGTQVKNIPALNFYIRNGFSKIVQTNTVLHYWH
ncbi:MAG: GNAT family N-acetyltransferase [Sulfuricurvum sp.]|nr:GNAT family N-acetyltransferase [Sulfuricurvum sp.]MDP3023104.1 GNAT family N-acetyltransferase [Sulfuricurvum sp.]